MEAAGTPAVESPVLCGFHKPLTLVWFSWLIKFAFHLSEQAENPTPKNLAIHPKTGQLSWTETLAQAFSSGILKNEVLQFARDITQVRYSQAHKVHHHRAWSLNVP